MKKAGLTLEGGAMRGLYIAGVIDIFMENNINFTDVVGVSAGAAFGCNYKSKQIGRAIEYSKEFSNDPRYVGLKSWITTGDLYNAKFVFETVPTEYYPFDLETYRNNEINFSAVITNIENGETVYKSLPNLDSEDLTWLRASTSMPLAARIVEIDGNKYLDGGMSDPIPYKHLFNSGIEKNVIVLTQVKGYQKQPSNSFIFKIGLPKFPHVAKLMQNRHVKYNQSLAEIQTLEKQGKVFVIRPSTDLGISRTEKDPNKLEAMYQLGRADALAQLDNLNQYLQD